MRALLAAGGTGGHLFPAEAIAAVLGARGHQVALMTDVRAKTLVAQFPAERVDFLPAATPRVKNPVASAKALLVLGGAVLKARKLIKAFGPDVVIGFGGYPTIPPLKAAQTLGLATVVHEANAVPGKANRFLANSATIFTAFPETPGFGKPTTFVGMPVRQAVKAAARPFEAPGDTLRLLVFGGSQGARIFADIVPPALSALSPEHRAMLRITQQCRPEDLERTRAAYDAAGIAADLAPFFTDLPQRMADAHLVVCRSGASTVAELAVIGRPSLLVPLPGALDQDQAHNAEALAAAGGAIAVLQPEFTAERLTAEIGKLLTAPAWLAQAADAARGFGRPDAAERFADAAENVAKAKP
ncbi:undecaprenyldiphospho-muramoylpentapeptide beta-N-acetylglucosaminyltransferase [Acuticoccus sp. MNP-M23]|uniref:undecaprenyldiphospho-muramoylpentapeptide beta-N-acetylglucosaminyltransferase n=1 Tax=Acuticoccus sp. MNP-M23 TaxID=3072793 RepID=UPI0028155A39|nr:undecaprenyldiphospho-muramoylpentapeptide beta-N-acetylglucosaminyltransferase [Acuticoccus sp. MNP-M23]WMS40854.1 undecaprenyldiphospho-muramoylpentapeptide beta-N-acetylglucosaminyltransferase [Acuticoccus sp. MNP-M23]